MAILIQDLRLAIRQLRQRPAFTLTAVLTLAIGMSVNAVAFTVVNGMLFRGSAARAAPDMGRIATTPAGEEIGYASLAEYERFGWPVTGGMPSAVVGERFWRTHLNAAPLAGLTLRLNNTDVHVAGVLPDSFAGPAGLYSPDVWLPLDDLALFNAARSHQHRDERWLYVFGRVLPGAAIPEVQGRVEAAAGAMARDWPDTHRERGARFRLLGESNQELRMLACISPALRAARVDPLVALRAE